MFLAAKGSELMSQKREELTKISNHKNKPKSLQLYCHFFTFAFYGLQS